MPPLKTALLYAAVGGLWILASDWVLHAVGNDPADFVWIEMLKGMSFVAVTAAVLFLLVRRFEKTRGEHELQYRMLLDQASDGIVIVDRQGNFHSVNARICDLAGYSERELLKLNIADIFRPEDLAEKPARFPEMEEGKSVRTDRMIRRKDGTSFPSEISAKMIPDGRFLAIVRDITERLKAEEALRASEEKYRLLFHNSPIGIFNYDAGLCVTDCNDAFLHLLKSSRENMIGLDMTRLRDQRPMTAVRKALDGRPGLYVGYYRAWPKQPEICISMRTAPILDKRGSVQGCVGIVEDITEQVRMEESVQEQKRFAENLIQNSAVATFVLDARHKVVIWNKACEELTGVAAADMAGTDDQWKPFYARKRPTLADVVIDADFDKLESLYSSYAKSALSPDALHAEGWRTNLNGKDRYILFDAAPIYDGKGALIAAIQTVQDITERKNAEDEVKRNYDTQAVITSLLGLSLENVHLEAILARALELILSIPWLAAQSRGSIFLIEGEPGLLVMKAQRGLDEHIRQACALVPVGRCICGHAALSRQVEFVDHVDERHEIQYDGIIPHGHYCVPIVLAEKTLGVISVYLNEGHKSNDREIELLTAVANALAGIIVRTRTEDSLFESERKIQAITDAAVDAIILIDDEQRIVYWNPAAGSMLGYQPEELAERNVNAIIPPRYRERHAKAFAGFVKTGQGALLGKTYEVSALRKDGSELPVELSVSGIRLKGKWHSVGVIRDISERKKLEQQLLHSQKMEAVGQLSGGLAHDFNNILTAIIGYGHILHMKMSEGDPLRDNVRHLLESADRAAVLTRSLLAFSRKQVLHARPVDLNEVLRRAEKLLRLALGESIELKTAFKPEDLTVSADAVQIEQVLMNLATNARDAMPHGGSFAVEIDVRELDGTFVRAYGYGEPGRYAVLTVTDTGTGMDEETRKRIFEPFFTTKEVGRGTGLGLSMTYGIIKQHQGYINAYSEPGRGTIFRIYLPLIDEAGESAAKATAIPAQYIPGGTETVLIAEDDAALRQLFRAVLEEFGYTVIEAEDGADAVDRFMKDSGAIKLVILDMIMPRKSGQEAYEEIKRAKPDLKALFISGYTADRGPLRDLLEGGPEFALKPISPRDLLLKVRAVLDA